MPRRRQPQESQIQSGSQALGQAQGRAYGHTHVKKKGKQDRAGMIGRSVGYGVERLESRTMLTTVGGPLARTSGQFDYVDAAQHIVQVSYSDVAFEAIFLFVDPKTNAESLVNAIAPATPLPVGADLYKIYIADSGPDSYIAVSEIIPASGQLIPYTGSAGPLRGVDVNGNPYVANIPGGTGGLLLGARRRPVAPDPGNEPIQGITLPAPFGLQPVPLGGILTPGVEAAAVSPTETAASLTGLPVPNNFGRFAFGGTVTGTVSFPGNVNQFYAGAVETGNAAGSSLVSQTSASSLIGATNFTVAGDLRNFITNGPVGTDGAGGATPTWVTNFSMSVGGQIGEIHVTQSNFAGTIQAAHDPTVSGLKPIPATNTPQVAGLLGDQVENEVLAVRAGDSFSTANIELRNDSAQNAQFLGSIPVLDPKTGAITFDAQGNIIYQASVDGNLQKTPEGDTNDFYAVPMMAGVTFRVTLSNLNLTVIDPDGRTIATNAQSGTNALEITADRPGVYYFEVNSPAGGGLYNLTVTNVGDMGIGAIDVVNGNFNDLGYDAGVSTTQGDFGAMVLGGTYASLTSGPTPSIDPTVPLVAPTSLDVPAGTLRVLQAGAVGIRSTGNPNILAEGPYLSVPFGNVGLLRSTGGVLDVHSRFDPNYLNENVFKVGTTNSAAIGFSIQKIDCASTFEGELAVNQGIGTIAAGDMITDAPSYIDVNADNSGFDGIIDLIDVSGQFGDPIGGGPQLVTNEGGHVRYLNVGGTVYPDAIYGTISPIVPQVSQAGQVVNFNDDAGTVISLTPIGATVSTSVVTNGTVTTNISGPQITLLAYPTHDKAGEIPINITSTGGLIVSATGTSGANTSVDLANVVFAGNGLPVVDGPVDRFGNTTVMLQAATVANSGTATLDLNGPARMNVLNLTSNSAAVRISNNTGGELAIIHAPSAGDIITRGNLGITAPVATAAAVLPRAVVLNGYPFFNQRTGVIIGGSAVNIFANGALGNISAGGTIQNIAPNADLTPSGSQLDAIVGPIVATRLMNVNIGQGLLPTGTGNFAQSGLFARGKISFVTNSGNQFSDIRGNIISEENDATNVGIDQINLVDGSIINCTIADATTFQGGTIPSFARNTFGPLQFDIGSININGRGGILGATLEAFDYGPIVVGGSGFGILNTFIGSGGLGRHHLVQAGGYGIRDSIITNGAYVDTVAATGNGSDLSVDAFPIDLRPSDITGQFDPFFHTLPSPSTDLNGALGTSAAAPSIPGVTDTGVISDDTITGIRTMGALIAHTVRTKVPVFQQGAVLPNPNILNIPTPGNAFPMSLAFGTAIGLVRVFGIVDGLQITTSRLGNFLPAGSVSRVGISVAGTIQHLAIQGNFGATVTDPNTGLTVPDSYIIAGGPSGVIGTLRINGSLFGNVTATGQIRNMVVVGDVDGNITADGRTRNLSVVYLRVAGGIRDGALTLYGNVGQLITNGGFGSSTGSLTVVGNVNLLSVGADPHRTGSILGLTLHVQGNLDRLLVHGQIAGPVQVDGNLNNLNVTGDGTTGNVIIGAINVGGQLGVARIRNGNVVANITANGPINSFTINGGSLIAGNTIQSTISTIFNFRILGGTQFGLFGSLLAPDSTNESVDISGNLGDGVDAASITAFSARRIRIRGSILAPSSIATTDVLNLLQVDGSIAAGATVTAHPLRVLKVKGTNAGTIVGG